MLKWVNSVFLSKINWPPMCVSVCSWSLHLFHQPIHLSLYQHHTILRTSALSKFSISPYKASNSVIFSKSVLKFTCLCLYLSSLANIHAQKLSMRNVFLPPLALWLPIILPQNASFRSSFTWNLYNFINQCHPNTFNKKIICQKKFYCLLF